MLHSSKYEETDTDHDGINNNDYHHHNKGISSSSGFGKKSDLIYREDFEM